MKNTFIMFFAFIIIITFGILVIPNQSEASFWDYVTGTTTDYYNGYTNNYDSINNGYTLSSYGYDGSSSPSYGYNAYTSPSYGYNAYTSPSYGYNAYTSPSYGYNAYTAPS